MSDCNRNLCSALDRSERPLGHASLLLGNRVVSLERAWTEGTDSVKEDRAHSYSMKRQHRLCQNRRNLVVAIGDIPRPGAHQALERDRKHSTTRAGRRVGVDVSMALYK